MTLATVATEYLTRKREADRTLDGEQIALVEVWLVRTCATHGFRPEQVDDLLHGDRYVGPNV